MTSDQYNRLLIAKDKRKYGHLETWEELYRFQRSIATDAQIQEIAEFAKRKNNGEDIKLPLINN